MKKAAFFAVTAPLPTAATSRCCTGACDNYRVDMAAARFEIASAAFRSSDHQGCVRPASWSPTSEG